MPLGVVAIIYESRPNVTSDAAVLAIKSGNVCVLRGGKEAYPLRGSHRRGHARGRCGTADLPETFVNLVSDTDAHESAHELMTANGLVDLLIPRGGAGLIRACVESATVPCIETGTGICHVYVDKDADLDKALNIIENAKTSRPSVCNAEEVCPRPPGRGRSVPAACSRARSWTTRAAAGKTPVELRLDAAAQAIIPGTPAGERDFDTEFLDYILAVKVVSDADEAIRAHRRALHAITPTPSSPKTRRRLNASPVWSTARQSTSTRPRASPTAASSASAARWAFPRRSSTPGARWACGS